MTMSQEDEMNLKEAREQANLSQFQVAAKVGVTQTAISTQEQGVHDLPLENMILTERAVGVNVEWEDEFSYAQKGDALRAVATLSERYPLLVVLEFAKKVLTNKGDETPIQTLQFVASQTREVEVLLPLDVQIENYKKQKQEEEGKE